MLGKCVRAQGSRENLSTLQGKNLCQVSFEIFKSYS